MPRLQATTSSQEIQHLTQMQQQRMPLQPPINPQPKVQQLLPLNQQTPQEAIFSEEMQINLPHRIRLPLHQQPIFSAMQATNLQVLLGLQPPNQPIKVSF